MSNSTNSTVIHPDYIRIVERDSKGWLLKKGRMFYKTISLAIDFDDFDLLYGISKEQVVIELFRVNGGKPGFYLADLLHKKFYYCGLSTEEIKTTLLKLGIGRIDPLDK